MTPFSSSRGLPLPAAVAVVALLAVPSTSSAAPAAAERAVADPPAHVVAGTSFTARDTAKLTGTRRKVVVRYYLSRDGRRDLADLRLHGRRTLSPGGVRRGRARVTLPHAVVPGDFRLLACADDTGALSDRTGDDCAASKRRASVTLSPAAVGPVRAFADTGVLPPDTSLPTVLGLTPRICPARASTTAPPLGRAIGHAEALLDAQPDARAAGKALRRAPAARSAEQLEAVAAGALVANSPGLALAALLRGHALQPRDPSFLVNAAGVAIALGLPRDALGMLKAADRLEARPSEPMGISPQAVALNARGQALLALGRFADADRVLRAAIALDPLLREADRNLAVARYCAKKPFVPVARRGLRRAIEPEQAPVIDQRTFDVSHGVQASLPRLNYPASFDAGVAQAAAWQSLAGQANRSLATRSARIGPLRPALTARLQRANRATRHRTGDILAGSLGAGQLEGVKEKLANVRLLLGEVDQAASQYSATVYPLLGQWITQASSGCPTGDQACIDAQYRQICEPVVNGLHGSWLGSMRAADAAARKAIAAYYPLATGLAANLSNPTAHRLAVEEAGRQVDSLYAELVARASLLTVAESHSVLPACTRPSTEPGPGAEAPRTPSSSACPPGLKGIGFNFKFTEVVKFELQVECEKVSVQASGDLVPGWIGAFGKVTYDPRAGTMSVFAGAKGGLSVDIPVVFEGVKGEAAWRSGVYVTIDRHGGLADAGFRTGPGVSGRLGGDVGVKASTSNEIDFSVIGVFGAGLGI